MKKLVLSLLKSGTLLLSIISYVQLHLIWSSSRVKQISFFHKIWWRVIYIIRRSSPQKFINKFILKVGEVKNLLYMFIFEY